MQDQFIKITHDPIATASMIRLNDGQIARTIEVSDQCFVDLSADNKVLGIELLGPSTEINVAEFPDLAIDFKSHTSIFRQSTNINRGAVEFATN